VLRGRPIKYYKKPVLPRGRNFGRKAQKGPTKIWRGREIQGPNFLAIYQKRAEPFLGLVFHQIIYIFCQKLYI
jgi:hypothetical protein